MALVPLSQFNASCISISRFDILNTSPPFNAPVSGISIVLLEISIPSKSILLLGLLPETSVISPEDMDDVYHKTDSVGEESMMVPSGMWILIEFCSDADPALPVSL